MAENQFKIDLEENDVKYFTFGMGEDEEFRAELEERFGLKVYHLGCSTTPPFDCYNKKVEQVVFESNSEKF